MKTSKLIACFIFWLFFIQLQAQELERRKLAPFSKVSIHGGFDIVLIQDEEEAVIIEESKIDTDLIKAEVEDEVLKISLKKSHQQVRGLSARITISYKELKALYNSGSSAILCKSEINGQAFELKNSGSGMVKIPMLKVAALIVQMSGSGGLDMAGTANEQELRINGSGSIRGYDLISEVSKINITGSGDAHVHVTERLSVKLIGSGNIRYKGAVKAPAISILGSGSVKRVG